MKPPGVAVVPFAFAPPPYDVVKIDSCVAVLNEKVFSSATPWFARVPLVVAGPDNVPRFVVEIVTALTVAVESDPRRTAVKPRPKNDVFMHAPDVRSVPQSGPMSRYGVCGESDEFW
jgi:hypothetical protein